MFPKFGLKLRLSNISTQIVHKEIGGIVDAARSAVPRDVKDVPGERGIIQDGQRLLGLSLAVEANLSEPFALIYICRLYREVLLLDKAVQVVRGCVLMKIRDMKFECLCCGEIKQSVRICGI